MKDLSEEIKYFCSKNILKACVDCLDDDIAYDDDCDDNTDIKCVVTSVLTCLSRNNFIATYTVFRTLADALTSSSVLVPILKTANTLVELSTGVHKQFRSILLCDVVLDALAKANNMTFAVDTIPAAIGPLSEAVTAVAMAATHNGTITTSPSSSSRWTQQDQALMQRLRQNVLYLQEAVFGALYKEAIQTGVEFPSNMPAYFGFLCDGASSLRQILPTVSDGNRAESAKRALDAFVAFKETCDREVGPVDVTDDVCNVKTSEQTVSVASNEDAIKMEDEDDDNDNDNGSDVTNDAISDVNETEKLNEENEWLSAQIRVYLEREDVKPDVLSGLGLPEECLKYARQEFGVAFFGNGGGDDNDNNRDNSNNSNSKKESSSANNANNNGLDIYDNSFNFDNIDNAPSPPPQKKHQKDQMPLLLDDKPAQTTSLGVPSISDYDYELDEKVRNLMDMGLSDEDARICLKRANNDIQKAVDIYFEKRIPTNFF